MINKTEFKILSAFDDGSAHDIVQISKLVKLPIHELADVFNVLLSK